MSTCEAIFTSLKREIAVMFGCTKCWTYYRFMRSFGGSVQVVLCTL